MAVEISVSIFDENGNIKWGCFGEKVRLSLSSQIGDSQCHDYKMNITVFSQLSIMRTINATSV